MNVLSVRGMHCKSCELILTEDLSAVAGVSNVTADHKAGKVTFDGPASALPLVKAAIKKDGYQVV